MGLWSRIRKELFGTVVGQSDYEPANRGPRPVESVPRRAFDDPDLQKTYDEIFGGKGYGGLSEPPPEPPPADPGATQPG